MTTELIFDIPRAEISWPVGGKDYGFPVRGLSDEDLLILVRDHMESIKKLFAEVESMEAGGADLQSADITQFGQAAMKIAPELVAQMIALAADKPDGGSVIRKMPAPIRLRAINEIWRLTVVDTGGLGPFLEQVFGLLRGLRTGMDMTKGLIQETGGTSGG